MNVQKVSFIEVSYTNNDDIRILNAILSSWFSDPKNKRKVENLSRFIKDWWPSLVGAFVFFFTPFGKFVRGILRIVGGFPRVSSSIVLQRKWPER